MESFAGLRHPRTTEKTLGQFALVSYIPDPLASFLDGLRLELTPGCDPHAHVTILPPRPIEDELKDAIHQIAEQVRNVRPFEVELSEIGIFEKSCVIYVGLAKGAAELRELYGLLNRDHLAFGEHFPYHPHITIGQNIAPEDLAGRAERAREKWAAWIGPRSFRVSRLSFVQHVAPTIWADVAALPVGVPVPLPVAS
jgi:2'-5' RNA ligase